VFFDGIRPILSFSMSFTEAGKVMKVPPFIA